MVKLKFETTGGKPVYGFGLSRENIRRLKNKQPISIDLAAMGGTGEVMIFYGRTEKDMQRDLAEFIDERTVIHSDPSLQDS